MVFDQQLKKKTHSHRRFRVNRKYSMYWGGPRNEVCYTHQGKKPRGQKLSYYYYAVLADCPRASVHSFLYEKNLWRLGVSWGTSHWMLEAQKLPWCFLSRTQEAMGHTGLTHVGEGDAKGGFSMYIPRDLLLVWKCEQCWVKQRKQAAASFFFFLIFTFT